MTKQEEIREGIEGFVSEAYWHEGEKNVVSEITSDLISYLYSEGLVMKVERELPNRDSLHTWYFDDYGSAGKMGYDLCLYDMLEAGYVAVEPLIEEE